MSLSTLPMLANGNQNESSAEFSRRFAASSAFFSVLPLVTIYGDGYTYLQEGKLPGMAFIEHQESFGAGVGVVNPQVEWLHELGGDLNQAEALGLEAVDRLINGHTPIDGKPILGLKHRPVNEMLRDLNGAHLTWDGLDDMIDFVDGPTHLLVDRKLYDRIAASDRGRLEQHDEGFGPSAVLFYCTYYGGDSEDLRVVAMGVDADAREIMTDENGLSSLLIAVIGDTGVFGLHNNAPTVTGGCGAWRAAVGVVSGRALARISGIA